jgi:hypothetical protein
LSPEFNCTALLPRRPERANNECRSYSYHSQFPIGDAAVWRTSGTAPPDAPGFVSRCLSSYCAYTEAHRRRSPYVRVLYSKVLTAEMIDILGRIFWAAALHTGLRSSSLAPRPQPQYPRSITGGWILSSRCLPD